MKLGDYLKELGRTVSYHPRLAKITGGVEANVLLCQLYYWDGKQDDSDGWIYKTQAQIEDETGITFDSQRTARSKLVKRGLIQERFKGLPRRLEIKLNPDALHERWLYFLEHGTEPQIDSDGRKNNKPTDATIEARRHKSIKSTYANRNNQSIEIENIDDRKLNKSMTSDRLNQSTQVDLIDKHLYTLDDLTLDYTLDDNRESLSLEKTTPRSQKAELTLQNSTPKTSALLPIQPKSLHQNDKPSCRSIVPESFDNHEQLNIAELPAVANQELSSREVAKLQKYQQLDADGIRLKQPELRDWAALEIAPYVRTYRKSGFILTGGNDVSSEFAIYVAKQNCRKGQEPTIALGFNVINKCETDPRHWQKLVAWVVEWQQQRHTGQTTNVAGLVNQQQQLDRIRQAASTKFEL